MSQLFKSGGQNIGASVSALVLPVNIQGIYVYVYVYIYIHIYIYIYIYIYLLPFEPPSHLPLSTPLGCHRVPGWASCVILQLLTSYLFYTICLLWCPLLASTKQLPYLSNTVFLSSFIMNLPSFTLIFFFYSLSFFNQQPKNSFRKIEGKSKILWGI